MNELPNELLLMILDKLPPQELHQVSCVCKRWYLINTLRAQRISKYKQLYVHNELKSLFITVPVSNLMQRLSYASNLNSLTITVNAALKPHDFTALANFVNLKHFDVFADSGIVTAMPPNLNSIVINDIVTKDCMKTVRSSDVLTNLNYFGRGRAISTVQLALIIHSHKTSLEELTLKCRDLPSRAYQIFSLCTKIVSLRLYQCWRLCKEHSVYVLRSNNLKVLHITGIRLLSSQSLAALIRNFPSGLKEVCLSASLLDDTHFDILIDKTPFLEIFEAWRCKYSPTGILKLANGLEMLQILDTDIMLSKLHLHMLDKHPSLQHVRCCCDINSAKTLKIKVSETRKKEGLFRNIGEGYRSDIFYYCNRNGVQNFA